MRNMSFALTTQQFIDGSKDVTRRLGWAFLKPGDHFMAVEKCQGLKKGEHVKKLGECGQSLTMAELDIPEGALILYTRVMLYVIAVCVLFTF